MKLKASKSVLMQLLMHFITFITLLHLDNVLVHLKKPSGGPKGLIGPPCHGALAAGGENEMEKFNKSCV
jgi:hypothetical protein